MNALKEVGMKIRSARKAQGWSQLTFSSLVNVSQNAVSKWENGNTAPNYDTLMQIAQICNKPVGWFFESADFVSDSCSHCRELADRLAILESQYGDLMKKMLKLIEMQVTFSRDMEEGFYEVKEMIAK